MFILLAQFGFNFPTPDYDEIANVLRDRGHTVWVGTPDMQGDLAVHNGIEIVTSVKKPNVPKGRFWALPGLKRLLNWYVEWIFTMRLRRFIGQNRPNIAHLNRSKLIFFWAVPLLASGATCHIIDWRQIGERNYRGALGKLKRFIAVQYRQFPSRHIYDQACFLHAAGASQVLGKEWQRWATVVPLAVSDRFLTDHEVHLDTVEEGSSVRFIYIGTLNRVRRLDRIILAAQELVMKNNGSGKFEVSFIGPDKTGGLYQGLIDQLGLQSYVNVNPPVPYREIPNTLNQYDVALAPVPEYPLDWQYHPTLKVLEYRAFGMPIIATDFEPNREVVQDGVNGILVSNTPNDIAAAMRRFICDDGFLRRCNENAQNMRNALLWQDVSEMYEQLYQRLLIQQQ